jgi:hypothetical protein
MTSTQTELELAIAKVKALEQQANQTRFDTLEHVGNTFNQTLEKVMYKKEVTTDKDGNEVSRIPLDILGSFISSVISSKYKVTVGQKFVNITNN